MKKMILWAAMALAAMGNVMASAAVNDDTVISKEYKLTGGGERRLAGGV